MSYQALLYVLKGSASSGNFGHSGRPGKVGGSTAGGGHKVLLPTKIINTLDANLQKGAQVFSEFAGDANKLTAEITETLRNSDVAIRMSVRAVENISYGSTIKNAHEVGTSGEGASLKDRRLIEKELWGYGPSSPKSERPVYAYALPKKDADVSGGILKASAANFGEAVIVLNDNVKSRTTFTSYDSTDQYVGVERSFSGKGTYNVKSYPSSVNNPSWVSTIRADYERKPVTRIPDAPQYIEYQVHGGGLSAKDIKKVYLPREAKEGANAFYNSTGFAGSRDNVITRLQELNPNIEVILYD